MIIEAVCQDAKRIDLCSPGFLDEEEVDPLRYLPRLPKARVRNVVPVMPALRDEVRDVRHPRVWRRHGLVRPVGRLAVEVSADERDRGSGSVALDAPLFGELDEQLRAVLASLDADMVKVSAHDDDACPGHDVRKLAHCDDAVEHGVPTPRRPVGGLAEPAGLLALAGPRPRAVEDGRELAVPGALPTPTPDMCPTLAQLRLYVLDLSVEALLEADEGALVASGDEAKLGDEPRTADGPGALADDGIAGCVANIVGDDAQGHRGRLRLRRGRWSDDVHFQ